MRVVRSNEHDREPVVPALPEFLAPQSHLPQEVTEVPLVLVTWRDAWFDIDQPEPGEWRSDYLVQTIGFLIRHTPHLISVAQEILPNGEGYRAVTHIPLPIIDSITLLSVGDPFNSDGAVNPDGAGF